MQEQARYCHCGHTKSVHLIDGCECCPEGDECKAFSAMSLAEEHAATLHEEPNDPDGLRPGCYECSKSVEGKSCEERIGLQLRGRLQDFDLFETAAQRVLSEPEEYKALEALGVEIPWGDTGDEANNDDVAEKAEEVAWEYPLSVETVTSIRIVLSTGGPHDEFVCEVEEDGEPVHIVYRFQDWYDGAERVLEGDEFLTAKAFLQQFCEAKVNS